MIFLSVRNLRSYIIFLLLFAVIEAFLPAAIYRALYARAHGSATPLYFDPQCYQVTVQLVVWIMACMALTAVASCSYDLLRPRGGWLVRTLSCRSCTHPLTPEDLYCPRCATTTATWQLPRQMLSPHARDFAEETAAAEPRIPPEVTDAATFLVDQARPVSPDAAAALVVFCLTNAVLLRRLYFTAALRLHPDRNNGELRHEWDRLQRAVRVLREYHRVEATA